jgi:pimeloyl-ACP methyl ester carboxylesterase
MPAIGKFSIRKTINNPMRPQNIAFLPGYACTPAIWREIKPDERSKNWRILTPEWPESILKSAQDFAPYINWLNDYIHENQIDVIVAHSMAGIISILTLNELSPADRPNLILCECFVTNSIDPFFRNLLMPDSPFEQEIQRMLADEGSKYHPELRQRINQVDVLSLIVNSKLSFAAIYGDRGRGREQMHTALNWPAVFIFNAYPVATVTNACHFPMLENPPAFLEAVQKQISILQTATPLLANDDRKIILKQDEANS